MERSVTRSEEHAERSVTRSEEHAERSITRSEEHSERSVTRSEEHAERSVTRFEEHAEQWGRHRFQTEEVEMAVREWFRTQESDFYRDGISEVLPR